MAVDSGSRLFPDVGTFETLFSLVRSFDEHHNLDTTISHWTKKPKPAYEKLIPSSKQTLPGNSSSLATGASAKLPSSNSLLKRVLLTAKLL